MCLRRVGVQPPLMPSEYEDVERVVKASPDVRAAFLKRGGKSSIFHINILNNSSIGHESSHGGPLGSRERLPR